MTHRCSGSNPRRTTRKIRGDRAEQVALAHLNAAGLCLLQRNFQCRLGEIDLVMRDGDCLVFVEVRFRSSDRFVPPLLTVDDRKQHKIARTASFFLAHRRQFHDCPVRFDVVAIESRGIRPAAIQWVKDAFRV